MLIIMGVIASKPTEVKRILVNTKKAPYNHPLRGGKPTEVKRILALQMRLLF